MTATASKPTTTDENGRPQYTRDQAADKLLEVLTVEPQSMAQLTRKLGLIERGRSGGQGATVVTSGLRVLEARHEAKRVPNSAGTRQGGWALYDSEHEAMIAEPQLIEFPYEFKVLAIDEMFIDKDYQRPLTSFVRKIESRFDPLLFGTLVISDRGAKNKPRRYAVVDGQTRWAAATRIGIQNAPTVVFQNLTPPDEARMFADLQRERRGMTSWHRFRAQLAAGDPESHAIVKIAETAGYKLGDGVGEMRAMQALESCYRTDDFVLERALVALKDAWPDEVPEAAHIRGLHYFFRNFPIDKKKNKKDSQQEIDDERLVRRLKTSGPEGLKRKASAVREAGAGTGTGGKSDTYMGQAIQAIYLSGGRST